MAIDALTLDASVVISEFAVGELLYFRAHGRNAQAWWTHGEPW